MVRRLPVQCTQQIFVDGVRRVLLALGMDEERSVNSYFVRGKLR
jgi:hypothetical protein